MEIIDLVKRLEGKKKIILTHGNSDLDAIGSAYGIKASFGPADIFAPAGIDRVSKMVIEKLGITVLESANLEDYELVVVVDSSSPDQLQTEGLVIPSGSLIIDHHACTGRWQEMDFFYDETRTSCCEIVKDIIDCAGIPIDHTTGLILLGGMLTDSGHFQYADHRALRAFADLLEKCQIPMDEALSLVKAPVNMSEKMAALKAIGRSKFERVGDMIVAVSFGSSYEAASCRALMAAGADVVFVGSQRDEEFRVSARATQEMVRRGVKLDVIMGQLSHETLTDGGGHGGAAGITGTGDAEAMVHMCMMKTMDEFRNIKKRMDAEQISNE